MNKKGMSITFALHLLNFWTFRDICLDYFQIYPLARGRSNLRRKSKPFWEMFPIFWCNLTPFSRFLIYIVVCNPRWMKIKKREKIVNEFWLPRWASQIRCWNYLYFFLFNNRKHYTVLHYYSHLTMSSFWGVPCSTYAVPV